MKITLSFTQEQLKKIKKIAKCKNLDLEDYLKLLIKQNIENKN